MSDELLAGLDEIDFRGLTGDEQAQVIPALLTALAEKAETTRDAERIATFLWDELTRAELSDSGAGPLAAIFLARMAIHHPWEHVRVMAVRLFRDLELWDEPEHVDLVNEVHKRARRDAYGAIRQARPGQDVRGAIGIARAIDGRCARLLKELRRLELRTSNVWTREAIAAIRHPR